ncbi:LAS superfamily LD-carboxypeptidase LdcB [Nocardia transvalensis]|uniref:LAS superfamily LD-carboxypeptidase LdcB n=1 Tax=Nocardia transvalensis TaxID=37333 RepID=A0A7W9UL22_9NOCA|nr:M15 family metallopeptidase [Nocardia transvalensis]MBB5917119.1 LAS superfamily LD-carboxypeptidase LdcB [Nocardia transvalensis]
MLQEIAGASLALGVAVWGPALTGPAHATTESAAGTGGLEPALAAAYSLAEQQAHAEGVPLSITSGYRTPEQQEELWQDGLATYGGPDEARRWVLPPAESTHVQGRAVDVGPREGAGWLEANGNRWGLCRTFDNEWWHFELVTAPGGQCPPRSPSAAER